MDRSGTNVAGNGLVRKAKYQNISEVSEAAEMQVTVDLWGRCLVYESNCSVVSKRVKSKDVAGAPATRIRLIQWLSQLPENKTPTYNKINKQVPNLMQCELTLELIQQISMSQLSRQLTNYIYKNDCKNLGSLHVSH